MDTGSGWEQVRKAIEEATEGYEPDFLIAHMIRMLLKNRYEGLILVDVEGKIRFMDRPTEKLFGLPPGGAKDKPLSFFFDDLGLLDTVRTGVPQIGVIQEVLGKKMVVTRLPLIKDGRIIGGVGRAVFHNLEVVKSLSEQVLHLEKKVKRVTESFLAYHRAFYTFDDIVGKSEKIRASIELAKRVSQTDSTVLLLGETGVGKELFAHAIHSHSHRSKNPFVRINCAGIPAELLESELFGYEKGAFTGAKETGLVGKFEVASGGTIFLDEVSCLPPACQAKLLRAIENKEIQPLGSTRVKRVDFRIIAATNENLEDLVRKGTFRQDLYYRIASVTIHIPPLRERMEDIPLLVETLLPTIAERLRTEAKAIDEQVLRLFTSYHWPGNVRELINALEQAIVRAGTDSVIRVDHLPPSIGRKWQVGLTEEPLLSALKKAKVETERTVLRNALTKCNWNKRRAASLLGISRSTLYRKLSVLQIEKN